MSTEVAYITNTTLASSNAADTRPELIVFYTLNTLLSSTLNIVVLVAIHHQRELQEYMRFLYQALATTDLLLGVVWSTWSTTFYFFHNSQTCSVISRVFPFLERVMILVVMALLCGISFNLYLLIARPLRYPVIVTKRRFFTIAVCTLIAVVLISAILLPIPCFPFSLFTNLLITRCLTRDQSIGLSWISFVNSFITIIPVCLTLVLTLVIYVKLLVIAYQKNRAVAHLKLPKRTKTTKVEVRICIQGDRHQPPPRTPNVDVDELRGQLEQRKNAGVYKRFKGLITVLLLWGSFCAVWLTSVIHLTTTLNPLILDMISATNAWTQPLVYLLTNEEARNLCLEYVRRRIARRWRLMIELLELRKPRT